MNYIKCFLLILLVVSCKNEEEKIGEKEFRLHGEVIGMDSGSLYAHIFDQGFREVDTIKVENGTFTIEGEIDNKVKRLALSTQQEVRTSDDPFVELYLEPGIMNVTLDISNLREAKLTGSNTMDQHYSLEKSMARIKEKYSEEHAAFEANWENIRKAATEEEKKELKWKDDDLRKALSPYFNETTALQKQFILDNPDSYLSFQYFPALMKEFSQEEARAIYAKFPAEYKTPEAAERIESEIEDMSKGIPGATVPDFNTVDINGEPVKMDDFKGKYLLIDFWASWCVPCRKGNPHLLDLYSKYNSKGFEILGVSDDDSNHDAWRKAVKEDGIGVWRHVLRGMVVDRSGGRFNKIDDGISGGYNISTLPTKILVDPDGMVIGRYGGGGEDDEALDNKLAEIFGK